MDWDFSAFSVIFVVVVIFLLRSAIQIVSQGTVRTVLRLGRYSRTLEPGFHIIVPLWERADRVVNMKETVLDVPRQEVITKDNAQVTVDGVVFYQITHAAKACYSVDNLELAIMNLATTNLRTVAGSMTLDDLQSQRDAINVRLLAIVDEATDPWGVKVTRVEIKDIAPPADLVHAMAQQKKAEQIKRAQILEAEGKRQAEILRAEGLKAAQVLEAEGRKQSAILEAEARERQAEAEARATELVSKAISLGDQQAIQYFVAQEYVKALGKFADSKQQKTVFLPLDATGVLGALGGVTELLKAQKSDNA
ncbi:MAG: SPFH domain-containing protein [Cardiobacteriaceae bacterium]|nr:SPFH domain-containing protein [Cardiobacteriaceae bacterium]